MRVKARQSHIPALWIPAYAGMTVRDAGNDGRARAVILALRQYPQGGEHDMQRIVTSLRT